MAIDVGPEKGRASRWSAGFVVFFRGFGFNKFKFKSKRFQAKARNTPQPPVRQFFHVSGADQLASEGVACFRNIKALQQ